ncbi:MAG TPA: cell division regulator GpsB [Bacillota bacterium]|nr:cell division regulator GpsB [Bacillota bacterium]
MEDIKLTAETILEKDFKTSMRGYNQVEVDEFLDTIIKDYEAFNQVIEQLKEENNKLKQQQTTPVKREQQESFEREQPAPTVNQVNYDVLKRLSNLEKAVFGKKYD